MLEAAKRWAAARGLRRIELNVMAHNHRAIALLPDNKQVLKSPAPGLTRKAATSRSNGR